MSSFIQFLVGGISLGSIYGLIALGYTMVYGIAKMLNFAHGDVIMVGGFTAFTIVSTMGQSPLVAIIVSIIVCTLLGVVIEKIAYKPLRNASSLSVLITAIGVSYLLQNLALLIFGSNSRQFKSLVPHYALQAGSVVITGEVIVTIVVSLIIIIAVTLFIKKTKTGIAMLAVSEDKGAAELMGINVNRTISITFAIGSALAAVAAVLLCSAYPQISAYSCRVRRYRLYPRRHDRRYPLRRYREPQQSVYLSPACGRNSFRCADSCTSR